MVSIIDCARMADAVYGIEDGDVMRDDEQAMRDKMAATRSEFDTIPWDVRASVKSTGVNSAFRGAVFRNAQEIVIAFKGTTFPDWRDWRANFKHHYGMNSHHYNRAQEFLDAELAPFKDQNVQVTVCGHSLGGAIAQTMGNRNRIPFVTFNAPGVAVVASRNVDQMAVTGGIVPAARLVNSVLSAVSHPVQAFEDITSAFYRVRGLNLRHGSDPVSLLGVHYGTVQDVPFGADTHLALAGDTGVVDAIKIRHSMENFLTTLSKEDQARGSKHLRELV